jgi:hypothetical protein
MPGLVDYARPLTGNHDVALKGLRPTLVGTHLPEDG